MNITELRYLVAIRKWGSVSAAAKQLYAAQPNVSKALKNLEEEYGIRIFERSSTGMIPTEQGRHFIRQAERVLGYLKRENEKTDQYTVGICHGDLNQHNIIFSSEKPALIHLEHAYVGIQIADLGNFMRKILEKYDWEERLGFEMLREYCRVHPLHRADLQGLYYRLSYPEKFWKLANHYYNSSKVWDPGRNYEKLQREIRQNISRKRFLEQFRIKILSQIS